MYARISHSDSHRVTSTAQLFAVLDITHESLTTGVPTTKRDAFYKDVPLFKTQGVVNRLVDDLAATWELRRSDLNIVSNLTDSPSWLCTL